MNEEMQREIFGDRAAGGRRFSWLGDGVFVNLADVNTCIRTYHREAPNAPLEEWETLENNQMRSIREYIEHGYGGLKKIMSITDHPSQWFLMAKRPYVVDMYISCIFFYNCYVCCLIIINQ